MDEQIYLNENYIDLMELNDPYQDCMGDVYALNEKDDEIFSLFKINSKKGYVGPFEIKESHVKGFYIVATDFIPAHTIVSEYCG